MIRKGLLTLAVLAMAGGIASADVVEQHDLTPAEVGTLPAALGGSYDAGTDIAVVAIATMAPAIAADHTDGDGHVLRVGDIGPGGGAYDFAFAATQPALTDSRLSAWLYLDWETVDSPTSLERSYMMMLRLQNADPQVQGSQAALRQGYLLAITQDSAWPGITPNPTDKRAFLMKRVGTNYALIGSESVSDIPTGWHYISIEITGVGASTTLKAYVDDVEVCSGTDADGTYTSGGWAVGYYEENGSSISNPYAAAFDNILVEDLTPPPPTAAGNWSVYE